MLFAFPVKCRSFVPGKEAVSSLRTYYDMFFSADQWEKQNFF